MGIFWIRNKLISLIFDKIIKNFAFNSLCCFSKSDFVPFTGKS
jgi:hypothetical protein